MHDEAKEKLKTELHNWVVSHLRSGISLHAITQALIIESHKLHEAADVVEAINQSTAERPHV